MNEQTRYIFSKGDLNRKDYSIVFKSDNKNNYIPIENIKELYLFNDCTITTKLLNELNSKGIVLHLFDYFGNYGGTFYPKENLLSGNITIKQSISYINHREIIAKDIVNGIAKNLYFVLYHYYRHGISEIKDNIDYIHNTVPKLLNKVNKIQQILMIEGNMWMRFYDSFKYILPKEFVLNKRVRRPPDNPINALISFGNSILYAKTITQIYNTHLNQTISYLHEPSEGRFSLSLDLSESFKPIIVFKTIFECVNHGKIKVDKHFIKEYNYCLLNDVGKKIFLEQIENKLNETFKHSTLNRQISYRQAIRLDGYKLIKFIIEDKPFMPFCEEYKK